MLNRFSFLLVPLLLLSTFADARHAIYNSVGRQKISGGGGITKVVTRGYFIFDPETEEAVAIAGFKVNGVKVFTVVPIENHRVVRVVGSNNTTYTVIAKAESPGTQFAGTILESVYMKGKDKSFSIDSGSSVRLPRIFITSSRAITYNSAAGADMASEASGSMSLDVNATRASNLSESMETAVERLTNQFIARGFTLFTPPPAE